MKKFLKYFFIIFLGLILVLYLIFRFGMGEMSSSEEELAKMFEGMPEKPVHHTYEVDGQTMHYVEIGADSLPVVLFIHGSPGSWDAFSGYMADPALLEKFRMISVDRIGYGKSSLGHAESSLSKQVACIEPILNVLNDTLPLIVAGHSFGGPVASRMAMEYPDRIDGLLLLAGLSDPKLEHRPGFLGPLRKKALRWLVPQDLDISNREIYPLRGELEEMDTMWTKINACTYVIQGDQDFLVEKENADYLERQIVNAPVEVVRLPETNHFFIWTRPELVREALFAMLKRMQ